MNKHTKAEDLNFLKIQTCVLKVSIHCEGCKKKVKKLLQKIDGVYTTVIDAEQGKVTVNGNINPSILIKKLSKAGKHAELWSAKKKDSGGGGGGGFELSRQLPKLAADTAKGQQKPVKGSEGKDQKLQLLQKELKDMKIPLGKEEKSAKFPAFDQEFEDGSEFDDEFDAEDDDFDETDDSVDDSDDDISVLKGMTAAPTKIAAAKQSGGGGGVGVNNKSNGSGGTQRSNNSGAGQGKGSGGNGAGGKSDVKSHGLEGVPTIGGAPSGFLSKGPAAAAPLSGGLCGAYQQQHLAEMMQQQRMMMTNGYPMAYGYPMPRSESYTNYFSDENTGGGCGIM